METKDCVLVKQLFLLGVSSEQYIKLNFLKWAQLPVRQFVLSGGARRGPGGANADVKICLEVE